MQWRSLDSAFVRAQERAGVRRQRFHDMRHAFATLLLDAGEEVAVISKMLGHADYSTTVDVYSHLSTERSRVAAARIDGLLKRARRQPRRPARRNCGQNCGQAPVRDQRPGPIHARNMVGAAGFEPTTTSPPDWCATRLRHAPTGSAV